MKLTEIVSYVFVKNGQYITGDLESIGLTKGEFWKSIKPVILNFQKYIPATKRFNVTINRSFDFTGHSEGIPEFISEVIPVDTGGGFGGTQFMSPLQRMEYGSLNRTVIPRSYPWRYRKPILYVDEPGVIDVAAHYNYEIVEATSGDPPTIDEVDIVGLEEDAILLDLLSAQFLQIVGRQRRAFVYTDLAITTDADKLAEEGVALEKEALSKLYDRHKWWSSVHV